MVVSNRPDGAGTELEGESGTSDMARYNLRLEKLLFSDEAWNVKSRNTTFGVAL